MSGNTKIHAQQRQIIEITNTPLCENFMGFGVEWDSNGYLPNNITDDDFELIKKRVQWMKFPVVRVMMLSKWCYKGNGIFDWNSKEMQILYRNLDLCEELGITVFLTDWGCEASWLTIPEIRQTDDPKYANIIGEYMTYLKEVKKYDCIQYFIFGNEPNLEVKNWKRWKAGFLNVHEEFKKRKLDDKIILTGSDQSDGDDWHRLAVDQLQDKIGAYDFHYYHKLDVEPLVDMYSYFRNLWDYVPANDPSSKNKPLIIAEAGIIKVHEGYTAAHNSLSGDSDYGIRIAEYAINGINAGSWSVFAWMLDDNSHYNFNNGMWKNKASDFELKPWFYSWSLLSRYFRPEQQILKTSIDPHQNGIKCLAAYDKKKKAWTICVVNPTNESQSIRLKAQKGGKVQLKKYIDTQMNSKKDSDGFPEPVEIGKYNLKKGIDITCEAKSMVLFTSLE